MPPTVPPPAHPKSRGELGEARFLARAVELGLPVARPWGDSQKYDFIVDCGSTLARVQVRAVFVGRNGAYQVSAASGAACKLPYTPEHIDFLCVLIVPEDTWYVLPVAAFSPRTSLWLFPRRDHERWRAFREAWQLFHPLGFEKPRLGRSGLHRPESRSDATS